MPSSGEREELAALLDIGLAPDAPLTTREMADRLLLSGYRRAPRWLPISEASRETCAEILGVQFAGGRMMREPFISFWSPTLNKFYCDPTHFMLLPPSPEDAKP